VVQNAQLKALESMLTKTTEFFERKVRRWFSKEFSTPYLDTFKIPWEEILLHYYEAGIESLEYNEVFDLAVKEYLPEFMNQADEEDQAFADSLINEQKATIAAKKAKDSKKPTLEEETSRLASNASKVAEKVQSIHKALDERQTTQPKPKAMSLKFDDEGDPENF
jgi:predicted nuclease with TOPRIM domain